MPVETTIIDPFHIATMGVCGPPLTIATDGFIVILTEDIIEVPILQPGQGGGAGGIARPGYGHKKKKKRITAIVMIDGTEYRESIELDDLTVTAKDVHVSVSTKDKVSIELTVIGGQDAK